MLYVNYINKKLFISDCFSNMLVPTCFVLFCCVLKFQSTFHFATQYLLHYCYKAPEILSVSTWVHRLVVHVKHTGMAHYWATKGPFETLNAVRFYKHSS